MTRVAQDSESDTILVPLVEIDPRSIGVNSEESHIPGAELRMVRLGACTSSTGATRLGGRRFM